MRMLVYEEQYSPYLRTHCDYIKSSLAMKVPLETGLEESRQT